MATKTATTISKAANTFANDFGMEEIAQTNYVLCSTLQLLYDYPTVECDAEVRAVIKAQQLLGEILWEYVKEHEKK
jgi:hypothetical protein